MYSTYVLYICTVHMYCTYVRRTNKRYIFLHQCFNSSILSSTYFEQLSVRHRQEYRRVPKSTEHILTVTVDCLYRCTIKYRKAACTVFLTLNTKLFETYRRQYSWIKSLMTKSVHFVGSSYIHLLLLLLLLLLYFCIEVLFFLSLRGCSQRKFVRTAPIHNTQFVRTAPISNTNW
jgi:hypothetical protein